MQPMTTSNTVSALRMGKPAVRGATGSHRELAGRRSHHRKVPLTHRNITAAQASTFSAMFHQPILA